MFFRRICHIRNIEHIGQRKFKILLNRGRRQKKHNHEVKVKIN